VRKMEKLMVEYCEGKFVPRKMCSVGRDGLADDCDGCIECCDDQIDGCDGCPIQECFNRLGEYEAANLTPEKILEMDKMYQELGREVMAYRKIGTVEECREAMKKQRGKKPLRFDNCTCPNCGTYNESVKKRRNTVNQDIVYCWHCGQAMEVDRGDAE